MTEMKYKLTEETINVNGRTLYRIEALKDFGNVRKGDKGGFIEKEHNLSQNGDCWIYDNAQVYDDAKVWMDASVCDNAVVCGEAMVCSSAKVCDNARICDNAHVYGNAEVND